MSAPATPGATRPRRMLNPDPNRTLLVLAAGGLAYALAQTMIVPALPEIQRDLKEGPAKSVDRLLKGTSRSQGVPEDFDSFAGTLADNADEPGRLRRRQAL